MITLQITDEKLQASLEKAIEQMLDMGPYNSSPIKSLAEKLIGTSYTKGELTDEVNQAIKSKIETIMASPKFDEMLGLAIVQLIAKREVDKMNKK